MIDTNVLLVASAADLSSPFRDTHVPLDLRVAVLNWLTEFRGDRSRRLALDTAWAILGEYKHQLTAQDFGLQVVLERLADAEWVELQLDEHGDAVVPPGLVHLDRSDRKLAATALNAVRETSVVNATDSDWLEVEQGCEDVGLRVENLLEGWLRRRSRRA